MPYVNNDVYLELAKLDYNNCQAVHRTEWDSLQKWYAACKLDKFGITRRALLLAYFVASASIYEPARWQERIAWAKTAVLVETITSYFDKQKDSCKQRRAFVREFRNCISAWDYINRRRWDSNKKGERFAGKTLLGTLNHIALDALVANGRDIGGNLREAWEKWLTTWQDDGNSHWGVAELLVQTINLSAGRLLSEELLCHPEYARLSYLTNRICHTLGHYHKQKVQVNRNNNIGNNRITALSVEPDMQELVQLVLQNSSSGIGSDVKQTFLTVAKSFYYCAYCDAETINSHIGKVLFQTVDI